MAHAFLSEGSYQPQTAMDIWAFGLFILDILSADRPEPHQSLVSSTAWIEAVQAADSGVQDPRNVPAFKAHLEYLDCFDNIPTPLC